MFGLVFIVVELFRYESVYGDGSGKVFCLVIFNCLMISLERLCEICC